MSGGEGGGEAKGRGWGREGDGQGAGATYIVDKCGKAGPSQAQN